MNKALDGLDLDVVNDIVNDQILIMVDKIKEIEDISPGRLQFALMHCLLFKTLTVIIELDGPGAVIPRVMDLLTSALNVTGHSAELHKSTEEDAPEIFQLRVEENDDQTRH